MKIIIVYYSMQGNTKYVADKIVNSTGADVLRLEPVKGYPQGKVSKFFWGGKSAVFGERPKLVPYKFDASGYDVIMIGTPVWAGTFAPPLKTFLKENQLSKKKIALYACNSGGSAEKCFDKLKGELNDCEVIATMELANPGIHQTKEDLLKIEEFCSHIL